MLVKGGCSVDIQNNVGDTALLSAVKGKRYNIINILVDGGVNIGIKDNNGDTVFLIVSKLIYDRQ